jgi:UDP-N-acetyl-D-glucosamine dehydrogenase
MSDNSITVLGLGYVGLPLALNLAKAGFDVTGFDLNSEKIQSLKLGKSYVADITDSEISSVVNDFNFVANSDLTESSTYIICVPTPLTDSGKSDISQIQNASQMISDMLAIGDLVVLESSTYPGTTEEVMIPILEKSGLKAGVDFFVGYAPERVNPGGNISYNLVNRVVSGLTPNCLEKVYEIYSKICDNVFKSNSIKAAEVSKLLENSYRLVNISLINSLVKYCEKIDISINDVIEAAKTKPFGFSAFYPSLGAGGHCIPIDPVYLIEKMEDLNLDTSLIRSAQKTNDEMHIWILNKIEKLLSAGTRTHKILFFGLTYKEYVNDIRHSYAIDLLEKLSVKFDVYFFDPLINKVDIMGTTKSGLNLNDINLNNFDLLVLNHSVPKTIFKDLENQNLIILDLQSIPLNLSLQHYVKL